MKKKPKCNCQFEEGHSQECPLYVEDKSVFDALMKKNEKSR